MAELEALGGAADPLSSRTVEATAEPRDLNEKVDKLITFMSNSAAHRIGSDSFMNDCGSCSRSSTDDVDMCCPVAARMTRFPFVN